MDLMMFDVYQEDGSIKLLEIGDILPLKGKFYVKSIETAYPTEHFGCQSPTEITIKQGNETYTLVEA